MTYGDMYKAIHEANFDIHSAGMSKGDVVAIFIPDSSHLLVYAVAVWQLGGIVTVIDPYLSAVAKVDLALVVIDQRSKTSELAAIPFTHYNVTAAIQMLGDTLVFQKRPPGELFLLCFPLWTALGLLLALHALCSHYHIILRDRFETHSLRNLLGKYKINILTAPLEMLTFLDENDVGENKLNSVTMVCTSSNYQSAQKVNSVLRDLDSTIVVFSMSECLSWPFVSLEIPKNKADRTPVLVAPNFECKITDPHEVECHAEVTGDIYVRGPACATTYLSGESLADQYGWIKTNMRGEHSEEDMCLYLSPATNPEEGKHADFSSLLTDYKFRKITIEMHCYLVRKVRHE
ncbi:AMP-binding domain containing protein [Trichuris trichiura]|uniref:AMP-binding domain containing protein n=1 Tax=Trichuris trichiura TaxID=36087 RepID=A0A077Z8K0_TRITR|nr:AMP-binding domain containing protein [Trichuris trichiura]